ncbi:DUF6279 family lipoprotein [Vibrio rumoiensis]|uniref:DUF6279 family lipoprotein n=1 Tax=Vibrio rumoiensis TaxID=76258 RepID=UPI000B5C359C|nr:DUF6279 family lipoprotein [Vibrio rumoiensis]
MFKRLIIVVTLLVLTGCSTQFFYNRLDWLATQYVDRYLPLNDAQESMVKQSVIDVRHWHRTQELPKYIAHIDRLLTLQPQDIGPKQVEAEFFRLKAFSAEVAEQAVPEMYKLFMTLDQEQADELFASLDEKYRDEFADYKDLSESEMREKTAERMTEALETWLGDLSEQQKQWVQQWSLERPVMAKDWFYQQQTNKSEVQVLFLQRNPSPEFKQKFVKTLLNPEQLYTAEFTEKVTRNRQVTFQMVSQVIQAMSDKQLEHYHEKLRDWRDTFSSLLETS